MALITAKATGNWSAGSTWDSDPALPAADDTVDCAGYTVTVDQDVTVVTLKSTGAGYFAVTAARTIVANVLSDTGHSGGGVVRCSHATGTVTLTGSVLGGPSRGVDNNAAGVLAITGNVTGGTANNARGAQNNSTGTITITGNVTGGASGLYTQGVQNASTGTVAITGNATGGAGTYAHGAANTTTGILTVDGMCIAGPAVSSHGIAGQDAAGITTYNRAVIGGSLGAPVSGYCKLAVSSSVNYIRTVRADTSADYDLSNDYPPESEVLNGTTYQLATKTGTLETVAPTPETVATAVLAAMNANPPAVNVTYSAGAALAGPLAEVTDVPTTAENASAVISAAEVARIARAGDPMTLARNAWLDELLPAAVSDLELSNITGAQVDLDWTHSGVNLDQFKIYRGEGAGSLALLATVDYPTTSYNDATCNVSTAYTYRVDACRSALQVEGAEVEIVTAAYLAFVGLTLDDDAASTTVVGNTIDGALIGANTADVAADLDGSRAFHLDGATQYVHVDFASIQPTANHILPDEAGNTWTRYASNPVLGEQTAEGQVLFGQIVRNPSGGWWYFGSKSSSVYRWSSDDLIVWTDETLVLEHGAPGDFDAAIQTVIVFQKPSDDSWIMLYRAQLSSDYRIARASSADGTTWTKVGLVADFETNIDPTAVMLVGSTYFVYVNGKIAHGVQYVYTSVDDCATFQSYAGNPIFPCPYNEYASFCPTVFPYGAYYYMIIPRYQLSSPSADHYSGLALYRCPDPYFDFSNREYLGRILNSDIPSDAYVLDVPSIPFNDVTKLSYPAEFGSVLYMLYSGLSSSPVYGAQMLASTTFAELAARQPITELRSLLLKPQRSFVFNVQFDSLTDGDVVLGGGQIPSTSTNIMAVIKAGPKLNLFIGGGYRATSLNLAIDTPYQIAIVVDDSIPRTLVYINNALVGTFNYATDTTYLVNLFIGTGYSSGFLDGYVWDFRLYQTALSAEQIDQIYTTGNTF